MRTYIFFCTNCCYKRFSNGDDISDLVEVATTPVLKNIVKQDEKGAAIPPTYFKQKKKFKCPNCGRIITAKPYETNNPT